MASDQNIEKREANTLASGSFVTEWVESPTISGLLYQANFDRSTCAALLHSANIPTAVIDNAVIQISTRDYIQFVCDLLAHLSDRISPAAFAAQFADKLHVSQLGVLGLALQNVPSIMDAINLVLNFRQLLAGNTRLTCSRRNKTMEMTYACDIGQFLPKGSPDRSAIEQFTLVMELMTGVRLFEDLIGNKLIVNQITFPFKKPFDADQIAALSPCPIVYEAENCSLTCPAEILAMGPERANPLTYKRYLREMETTLLPSKSPKSIAERVHDLLQAHLPPLSRSDIARTLAVSERTLSRLLQQEGTTYQLLLNKVKLDRAIDLLEKTDLSLTEISGRLGYSEPAAFTRAFKAATGRAPSQWKAHW